MQPGEIGGLLQLRQHMGHLITNLQVYLQLDVVESSYDRLLQEVAAAQVRGRETSILDASDITQRAKKCGSTNVHRAHCITPRMHRTTNASHLS